MPEERWNEKDISIMDGCWSLASDYRLQDIRTRRIKTVASWEVCFDESGRGQQKLVLSDGTRCAGSVSADFQQDNTLRFDDADNVPCSDDSYIFKRGITCRRASDERAECTSVQPETGQQSRITLTR